MSDKLDRFTPGARFVLTVAQEEALRLNHAAIDTEHLLLALMREKNSLCIKVLQAMGVEPGQVLRAADRAAGHGETPRSRKPTLSQPAKSVIMLAVDEARRMGHHYIGSGHLLLGVIGYGEGIAVTVLRALGLDLNRVRIEVARAMLQKPARETVAKLLLDPTFGLRPPDAMYSHISEIEGAGTLDVLIGRDEELTRLIEVLSRQPKESPLLIGEPGVGKAAIVKRLAQRMRAGEVPASFLTRKLWMFTADSLIGNYSHREFFAKRVREVLKEGAVSTPILFIDEIDKVVAAAHQRFEIVNVIKLALSQGEVQIIGAMTPSEYRRHADTDEAREWYFQPIEVKEPSTQATIEILGGLRSHYEDYYQVRLDDVALDVAAHLTARYVSDRFQPAKAIDLINKASRQARMHKMPLLNEVRAKLLELKQLLTMKQEALDSERFEEAIMLHYREVEVEAEIVELDERGNEVANRPQVTMEDLADVVAAWTETPLARMIEEERARLQGNG